jgi:hypothetical protein
LVSQKNISWGMHSTCTISLHLMGRKFLSLVIKIMFSGTFLETCTVLIIPIAEFHLSFSTMYVAVQYMQKELLMLLCFYTQRSGFL